MIAKCLDRHSGFLSILWTVGVPVFFNFWLQAAPRYGYSASLRYAPIIFLGWFAIVLLLVLAGLRRGNRFDRFCSVFAIVFTVGLIFYITEPLHNIIRHTENLFRKDEYANVYYGAPECDVNVSIRGAEEVDRFNETVRQFAKQEHIRECRQKRYMQYSGPPRPAFKGDHVAIWSRAGSIRLAQYDQSYPSNDFRRLADKLTQATRATFPGRVEVAFKEAFKQ
jgi:ABC-type multidrug transport system fused ATPase/permease subunit